MSAGDGCGYPDRLAGEEIPLGARIVAVCDTFDAIVTDRTYRKAQSREAAVAELQRCAGTQFDPQVVAAFVRVLERQATVSVECAARARPRPAVRRAASFLALRTIADTCRLTRNRAGAYSENVR